VGRRRIGTLLELPIAAANRMIEPDMSALGVITDIDSASLLAPQTTQHGARAMRVVTRAGSNPIDLALTESAAKDLAMRLAQEINRHGGLSSTTNAREASDEHV
jgi:hypothetical protein